MNIILYVTGSISCYKSIELSRELTKKGHEVVVILSHGAEKFIKKEIFEYLGIHSVYGPDDDFTRSTQKIKHIDLSRWCNLFVVCPASANTISHLACGLTKDLGTTTYLALDKKIPKLIFPAMNTKMLENKIIENHIKTLEGLNNTEVLPTESGILACGENGLGKLLELNNIIGTISNWPIRIGEKNVLISTGASIAPLDDVRYLTNPASGKTGYELAEIFLQNGYQVKLISGIYSSDIFASLQYLPNFEIYTAKTTVDYLNLTKKLINQADIFISAAAICDIAFEYNEGKIKKDSLEKSLSITQAPDVLKEALKTKRENQFFIGFAAEKELSKDILYKKWASKKVDLLIGTQVNSGAGNEKKIAGFKVDSAKYKFFENQEVSLNLEMTKKDLSNLIFQKAEKWFN